MQWTDPLQSEARSSYTVPESDDIIKYEKKNIKGPSDSKKTYSQNHYAK